MIYKINFLFVTLFGIGKLPKIPGSYASLATTLFLFFTEPLIGLSEFNFIFRLPLADEKPFQSYL